MKASRIEGQIRSHRRPSPLVRVPHSSLTIPFFLVSGSRGRMGTARARLIPACLPLVIRGCPGGLERCVYLRRAAERPHGAARIPLGPIVARKIDLWLAGDPQGRAAACERDAVAVQRAGLGTEN